MPDPQAGAATPLAARMIAVHAMKTPYLPHHYRGEPFDKLKDSIRRVGIQVPLVVSALGNQVDGSRRLLAARELGLAEVPVVVNPAIDTPEKELAAVFATETASPRNPLDHALMLRDHMRATGRNQKETASATGLSESLVSTHLAILDRSDEVQVLVGDGTLTRLHLQAVCNLPPGEQDAALLRAAAEGLSARKLAAACKPPKAKAKPKVLKVGDGAVVVTFPSKLKVGELKDSFARVNEKVAEKLRSMTKANLPVSELFTQGES